MELAVQQHKLILILSISGRLNLQFIEIILIKEIEILSFVMLAFTMMWKFW